MFAFDFSLPSKVCLLKGSNQSFAQNPLKPFCMTLPFSFLLQGVCTMTAAFLHFFFLSSFCWVLTEAWQSYLAVIGRIRTRLVRKRFLCLGWGKVLFAVIIWFPSGLALVWRVQKVMYRGTESRPRALCLVVIALC